MYRDAVSGTKYKSEMFPTLLLNMKLCSITGPCILNQQIVITDKGLKDSKNKKIRTLLIMERETNIIAKRAVLYMI